jgi:hypothetical protein
MPAGFPFAHELHEDLVPQQASAGRQAQDVVFFSCPF